VSLKVVKKVFTYEEAKEFLSDYWYWNPQEIICYEQKYFEVAENEPRLTDAPIESFRDDVVFFAFSTLFGEDFLTYEEAKQYCTAEYNKLPVDAKPNGLLRYYQELRKGENRLPSTPLDMYKNQGWDCIEVMFGLPEPIAFYTYEEAKHYCTGEYNKLPEGEKPNSLYRYYQELIKGENRLPCNPGQCYKNYGWMGMRDIFGLPEPISLYSYEQAKDYCIGEYNKLPEGEKPNNLNRYYQELIKGENRLPCKPDRFYKNYGWMGIRDMFGLPELYTYEAAKDYCTGEYNNLPEDEKPNSLQRYYRELRKGNNRLPSTPTTTYKHQGWVGLEVMFGLPEPIAFYTYEEVKHYCTGEYNNLPEDEKLNGLRSYYQELRKGNNRLPSNPDITYKKQGWMGIKGMFGID
jgi:viroplasmin and RNaseH domain-containing protein